MNAARNAGGEGGRKPSRNRRGRGRAGAGAGQPAAQAERRGGGQRGGNGGAGGGGGGGGKSGRNNRGRSRGRNRNQPDPVEFWGDPAQLPETETGVQITDEPAAVPRSLGPPPLPGHEQIAANYFAVVYDRAVTTAGALAAAGGLIDPDGLREELEDD
ncbi:hypothetical protein [Egicoccus sp. AB-alg6-2]|uniref:hypothetical protein n=1 Tax=Egicoccus sp. AB-alg6-2 TaxID=3242692 RepID=UPI00359F0593